MHIGIFDAVVNHLYKVPGTIGADVGDTGLTLSDSRNGFQNWTKSRIGLLGATGHDRGTLKRTFLTPGDTGPTKVNAIFGYLFFTPHGVGVEGIATIDDDVTLFKPLGQLADDGVGAGTCLHHDDCRSWL
jgi:hypothetical protein